MNKLYNLTGSFVGYYVILF